MVKLPSSPFFGDIQLHDTISLKGVLYVPSFKDNLLSVAKFTKKLHIFFTDHTCMMQDTSLKHNLAIGILGTKINDLYVFDHRFIMSNLSYSFSVFNHQTQVQLIFSSLDSKVLLWHHRFGHLPLNKLHVLSLVPNCNKIAMYPCVVCA